VPNERDNMMTSMPIKAVHHAHVSVCFQYIIRACTFQCQNLFSVCYRTVVSEISLSVCSNWRDFQLRLLEESMENENLFCYFPS
jgi:excinuclease UvrABC nuclease subunit